MDIQVLNINNRHSSSIDNAIKLLNLSQTDFHFKLIESGEGIEILREEYLKYSLYSGGEVESVDLKEMVQKNFNEEGVLYISVISEFLVGETYLNLFSEIITENGIPLSYSFVTDYEVKEILEGIPFEVYFVSSLLRYSIFYASKQYIAHVESEVSYCMFDYLIDKPHIVNLFKTGNVCLDCQMKLDDSLSLNQILSINSILRINGRVARSKEPGKLFRDYLYLSESLKKEREINKNLLHDREIIESIISNLSRISTNLLQGTPSHNSSLKSPIEKSDLKALIGKCAFNKVFDDLITYTAESELTDKYNEIILLQSRHYRLEIDIMNGIVNSENEQLRKNKISKSLIRFIDAM